MAIISKSFTSVGASATLAVDPVGEVISFALSGTYAATITFERAKTSEAVSWETVPGSQAFGYSRPNATVGFSYTTRRAGERFRTRCIAYTSGTAVTTATSVSMGVGGVVQLGAVTEKNIPVWGPSNQLQDGANTTGPFYLRSSNGILAKFQDNGVVANYPIFTATASGAFTITSAATNSGIDIIPNGTGGVRVANQLQVGMGPVTWSGEVTPGLTIPRSHSGTITGTQPAYNSITISSDTADASAASNPVAMLHVAGNFAGKGGRTGIVCEVGNTGTSSEMNNLHGGSFWITNGANCGGTNLTNDAKGSFYGIYPQVLINNSAATNLNAVVGGEIDLRIVAGASTKIKIGLQVVQGTDDAVQGSALDAGYVVANQGNTTPGSGHSVGWRHGVAFGHPTGHWPIHPTNGTVIGVARSLTGAMAFIGQTCQYGIDFSELEPAGYSLRFPGFWVDKNAVTKIGPATITPATTGVTIDCDGQYVSAVAVAAGGANFIVGEHVYDGLGGVYNVATLSGSAIATLTIINKAYSASPPSNPVTLTGGHGSGATVNLTWTASKLLALNPTGDTITGPQSAIADAAVIGFFGIPSGAGAPSGAPTNESLAAMTRYATTADRLWIYNNVSNAWKFVALA